MKQVQRDVAERRRRRWGVKTAVAAVQWNGLGLACPVNIGQRRNAESASETAATKADWTMHSRPQGRRTEDLRNRNIIDS